MVGFLSFLQLFSHVHNSLIMLKTKKNKERNIYHSECLRSHTESCGVANCGVLQPSVQGPHGSRKGRGRQLPRPPFYVETGFPGVSVFLCLIRASCLVSCFTVLTKPSTKQTVSELMGPQTPGKLWNFEHLMEKVIKRPLQKLNYLAKLGCAQD